MNTEQPDNSWVDGILCIKFPWPSMVRHDLWRFMQRWQANLFLPPYPGNVFHWERGSSEIIARPTHESLGTSWMMIHTPPWNCPHGYRAYGKAPKLENCRIKMKHMWRSAGPSESACLGWIFPHESRSRGILFGLCDLRHWPKNQKPEAKSSQWDQRKWFPKIDLAQIAKPGTKISIRNWPSQNPAPARFMP